MKNVFAISLILVALVECTMTDALQSSDIVRFKAISHRVNEFVDIGDKYYSIQLATELSEKADKIVSLLDSTFSSLGLFSVEGKECHHRGRILLL